jgi:hypothetical protein
MKASKKSRETRRAVTALARTVANLDGSMRRIKLLSDAALTQERKRRVTGDGASRKAASYWFQAASRANGVGNWARMLVKESKKLEAQLRTTGRELLR